MRRRRGRRVVLIALAALGWGAAPVAALPPGAERVVGGRPATQAYPYAALLRVDGTQRCAGALISARYVLTAGHCLSVHGAPAQTVEVALGNVAPAPGLDYVRAEHWEAHPGPRADVGLVRLPFASSREPLRLPRPGDAHLWAGGVTGTALGWGFTEDPADGGSMADVLREVDLPLLADAECHARLGAWGGAGAQAYFDPQTMLCAGGGTDRDTCDGDSGGPLLVSDGSAPVLAGSVSFGLGPDPDNTCAEGPPAFYARVGADPLNAWIRARVPQVEIDVAPARPRPGDLVRFDAVPSGPAGFDGYAWDLDGDGRFDDATGRTISRRLAEGRHEVAVRARRGLEAERRRLVVTPGDPGAATAAVRAPDILTSRARATRGRFELRYRTAAPGLVRLTVEEPATGWTLATTVDRAGAAGAHRATLRLSRRARRLLGARDDRALPVRVILAVGEDRTDRRTARVTLRR